MLDPQNMNQNSSHVKLVVLVARPRRCLALLNPVPWQNWMAAYLGYTLRMRTLYRGWPIMVNDMHTRRRLVGLCSLWAFVFWQNYAALNTTMTALMSLKDVSTNNRGDSVSVTQLKKHHSYKHIRVSFAAYTFPRPTHQTFVYDKHPTRGKHDQTVA